MEISFYNLTTDESGGSGGRSQAGNHYRGGLGQTSPLVLKKPNFYSTYTTKHQQTGEVSHYELKYLF